VRGVKQIGEVVFAEAFRFAFAATVDHGAVDDARLVSGAVGDDAGNRQFPPATPGDGHDRGGASPGPGAGPGWSQRDAGLVGETDPRAQPARDPFTAGH